MLVRITSTNGNMAELRENREYLIPIFMALGYGAARPHIVYPADKCLYSQFQRLPRFFVKLKQGKHSSRVPAIEMDVGRGISDPGTQAP